MLANSRGGCLVRCRFVKIGRCQWIFAAEVCHHNWRCGGRSCPGAPTSGNPRCTLRLVAAQAVTAIECPVLRVCRTHRSARRRGVVDSLPSRNMPRCSDPWQPRRAVAHALQRCLQARAVADHLRANQPGNSRSPLPTDRLHRRYRR